MSGSKRRRPSAGLVVGVIALVAALAGTAVGGVAVTSLSKQDKKQVKRIAKKLDKKPLKKAKRAEARNVAAAFSDRTVVDTGADPVEAASATIKLQERSRLLASATLTAVDEVADNKLVLCWLNAGGDPGDEANDISTRPFSEVVDFQTLAVNGSVVKDPGTHTVRLYCDTGGAEMELGERDLIVWAAAP